MNGEYDHRKEAEADRDRWKARALDAESKIDGQAWDDLVAERDALITEIEKLRPLIETARTWRAVVEAAKAWAEGVRLIAALGEPVTPRSQVLVAAVDALNRGNPDLYELSTVSDPCPVCGQDNWPAGSAGNARRIHELAEHEGDPRIEPRWWDKKKEGDSQ